MHASLLSNNDFLNFGEFKIIMLNVISNTSNSEGITMQMEMVHSSLAFVSLRAKVHINVLIKNNSTFND
jgi:hypothetical protein